MITDIELIQIIDAEFSAAEKRLNEFRAQQVQEFQIRQERLEQFERTLDELRRVWEPRLDALAKKFGPRRRATDHRTRTAKRYVRIPVESGQRQIAA